MKLGIKSLLLIVAIVLFLAAIFVDGDKFNLLAGGLAAMAAAFLLGGANIGGRGRLL